MSRTALIVAVLVTAGLFSAGCGQQEQGQDVEVTEEVRHDTEETASGESTGEETIVEETTGVETVVEETTGRETIVEETTQRETPAANDSEQVAKAEVEAAPDSEQVAEAEIEAAPPIQAANPPPSDGESQPPDGLAPSQGLGANEAGQTISNPSAISPAVSIVFLPLGNGVTYSCTGGPPFVHHGHYASLGNCAVEHVGPPAGLVCDIPTTITIAHDIEQLVFDAAICYSGADAAFTSPETASPAPAQPYPFETQPAPYGVHHGH